MNIAIYTLTSSLHDDAAVAAVTKEFLDTINVEYDYCGGDFATYGSHSLDLIFVRTGGSEALMLAALPTILAKRQAPIYLLTSGKSNSLAASLEILSYLRQNGIQGEVLHGSAPYIQRRIAMLLKVSEAKRALRGMRLGVIGKPSDWLISSTYDSEAVNERLGIRLVDITMDEMKSTYDAATDGTDATLTALAPTEGIKNAIPGALRIYNAIRAVVERHSLDGFSIRCFDLLTAVKNTGCLALARLNAEGIVAGCEGDVPTLLTMSIAKAVTGVSGFQANPAHIDVETGEMMLAHCTIPLNMVERYELDTHFESGIGIGIRGYMKEGAVTILKVAGDLSRLFVAEGTLLRNEGKPNLCRTQQVIRLSNPSDARYFLTNPIGNHHVIVPGHWADVFEELMK